MKIMRNMARLVSSFDRDEHGSSMTEFVFFLPVWVIIFIGVVSLGSMGVQTTKVQMIAQMHQWNNALPVTEDGAGGQHSTPLGWFPASVSMGSTGRVSDIAGAAGVAAMAAGGTIGESSAYALPTKVPPLSSGVDTPLSVSSIVSDGSGYPFAMTNDSLVGGGAQLSDSPSGGIMSVITLAFSSSGLIHSQGAGNRYGFTVGEMQNEEIKLFRGTNFNMSVRYDLLAAPKPLTGTTAQLAPLGIARLLAETEENYRVMMNFGESEWEGDSSGDCPSWMSDCSPGDPEDGINNDAEDEAGECDGKCSGTTSSGASCPNNCSSNQTCTNSVCVNNPD